MTQTKNGKPDPREWWYCENDYCGRKLAKVLKTDSDIQVIPEAVEIHGINGEKFRVLIKYVSVYCSRCGTMNELFGARPWNKNEWTKVFREIDQSGFVREPGIFDGEFLINPFKRNLLLKALTTEAQRKLVDYLCKHFDGEWTFEDAAKELGTTREIFLKNHEAVDDTIIKIESDLQKEKSQRYLTDAEETRRKFSH
jgi:hypothetical protein